MYYVYLLYSRELNEFYLGYTSDLKERLRSHQSGENEAIKKAHDWILAYYEAYLNEHTARKREANLKRSGKAQQSLKQRVRDSLEII